ncbi:YfaZ family outer membrane protein [Enterobacillus tribolii]|uniref:YfaZ n=1 Tax=Enterobacillus tribolii TaxID=1487935 RepID=A0A370R2E7_9GAMM|nr:YfaZ family outer membrane protein [Enterobacillus tribolii]MBW7983687.1 porin [Enterobacillus tribolii]RDK96617.1 YfaZ precursor [Enterobacillus tribolii]
MNKLLCGCACAALFLTAQAGAVEISGQAGEHYTNVEAGFGTGSSGLYSTLSWAHSDNDGDVAGLGLGLNVPLGPFMASVGGKALYLNPDQGDEGYAAAVGGGLQLPLSHGFSLYGSGYYAPDSLSSGVNSYREASGGLRWTIMRPVSVDVGYRYMEMEGKDGSRDNVLADGPYFGVGVGF